jgi:hypothetical protein
MFQLDEQMILNLKNSHTHTHTPAEAFEHVNLKNLAALSPVERYLSDLKNGGKS